MSYEPTEWKNGDIITEQKLNNIETGVRSMNSEYVPTVWENGDIITAEKLNHIEQGIVAGGDTEQWETLFEGEVTTEDVDTINICELEYNKVINNDIIKVTFDGTEYMCEKITMPDGNAYGGITPLGPDFSEYPFGFMSQRNGILSLIIFFTESAGTYSLKIEAQESGGDSDFSTAEVTVNNAGYISGTLYGAFLVNVEGFGDVILPNMAPEEISGPLTCVIPNSGLCVFHFAPVDGYTVELSGDIQYLEQNTYAVTGDCTIRIKSSK